MNPDRITRIVGIVVGALILVMGVMKFASPAGTAEKFVAWGWPAWLGLATGAGEVVAGALLLVPRTRLYGAALTLGIMSGAIFTHLRVPEVGLLPLAIPVFAASAYVAWQGWAARAAAAGPA